MENYGNNGLITDINIVGNITSDIQDKPLFDDYGKNSVKDIFEDSHMSQIFFSEDNINNIHKLIRYRVYKETNKIIEKQSNKDMLIIMRSIFLQYGDASISTINALKEEIIKLNEKATGYAVNNIVSHLGQHDTYIKDISTMPRPMDLPVYDNKKNTTYDISNLISQPHQ